jgi:hypothetical protein
MIDLRKPQQFDLPHLKERLPDLIKNLSAVNTQYSIEKQHIGEAITVLRLVQDLLV